MVQFIYEDTIWEMIGVLTELHKNYPEIRKEILGKLKLNEKKFGRNLLDLTESLSRAAKERRGS